MELEKIAAKFQYILGTDRVASYKPPKLNTNKKVTIKIDAMFSYTWNTKGLQDRLN